MKASAISIAITLLVVGTLRAQPVYNNVPDWISADTPVSTGGALVDLDQDGWLDFVVGNGNDIYREELVVYYNQGDGTLPSTPDWYSADQEYNGHVSVADVDGDGWIDVAVGLTLDDPGTPTARVYLNNAGTLSSLPDWSSPDEVAAFQVTFGDVNGDGRPDLAVGTGFGYHGSHRWSNYVYLNVGGALEATASWVSDDVWDYTDIFFCDVDDDGWLDLVGVGENTHTWVYLNDGGTLDTVATWHTTDNAGQFSVMGTYGDVDDDGLLDLFVTDNTQLFTGSGDIRRYDGLVGGLFTTTPTWTHHEGYGSAVALADIDADGDLDLATGSWWGPTNYFLNNAGLYPADPDWSSSRTSVIEAICFGDVNRDGQRYPVESFDVTTTPGRHLFRLAHQPVEQIDYVHVDGVPLDPDEFTFDMLHGWVSVGPEPVTSVTIRYVYSVKPDMAITNWDNIGNYLYYNQNEAAGLGDFDADGDVDGDDFDAFAACFTGPGGGPVGPECVPGDFDVDDDVDCHDWDHFVLTWTEPEDPPAFAGCPVASPLPAPAPHDTPKNRYVSFDPDNPGLTVAFQIELTASAYFPDSTGVVGWIGEPDEDGLARIAETPFYSGAWPDVVHVGDCPIVPVSTYAVRATEDADYFSAPLAMGTIARPDSKYWADVVGVYGGVAWTGPNGVVNMDDVMAAVQKFQQLDSAPHLTWVDVDEEVPNAVLNMTDIFQIVQGFKGEPYPFSSPADCP